MAKAKEKITCREFKEKDGINFWCGSKHYLILNGVLTFGAGGIEVEAETEQMRQYLKRKKLL